MSLLPPVPTSLLNIGPLSRTATKDQAADHDRRAAELARYKLGRLTADDADGSHRVASPARHGQDPLPPAPIVDEAEPGPSRDPAASGTSPGLFCTQQTITVPADVLAKTSQKHDYPSAAWRRSYTRRTGAERSFATVKDPAASDIARGWCRLMGLTPLMLFTTMLLAVRNQRILTSWDARQQENQRRAAAGLPPKTRRRRRKTLTALAAAPP